MVAFQSWVEHISVGKFSASSSITVDLPSLGGRWPDTTGNKGDEGLALEARSLQEVNPYRLGTQGMGECSEAPPTIQAEMGLLPVESRSQRMSSKSRKRSAAGLQPHSGVAQFDMETS